jgi:DNA helicase-2/ATP-dependent DNA helicase PcrA
MLKDKVIIIICVCLCAAFIIAAGTQLDYINTQRKEMKLISNEPLANAPPSLAFATVTLGAFRGLIVDILWLRADRLKEQGQFFDAKQLAEWITVLQPRFSAVWEFQAWNMAYNISVAMPSTVPEQRWTWVKNGYELLRDQGIPMNPRSIQLYRELGRIFQHKISGVSDDAHMYYKLQLALSMEPIIGDSSDPNLFKAFAAAPKDVEEILKDPNVNSFVQMLKKADEAFGNNKNLASSYLSLKQQPASFKADAKKVMDKYQDTEALRKFDVFARAYILRNQWKLEPELVEQLNNKYGPTEDDPNIHYPLDWRHPDSHAIYWGYKGLQAASKKDFSIEETNTDRIVVHSLQNLYRYGKIFIYENKDTGAKSIFLRPDLRMFDSYHQAMLPMFLKYEETNVGSYESMQIGHKNMLANAAFSFYQAGHLKKAEDIYNLLRKMYPRPDYNVPIVTFMKNHLKSELEVMDYYDASEQVMLMLRESYFRFAIRDDDEAVNRERLAKDAYDIYRKKFSDQIRIDLPELKVMRLMALIDFLNDSQYPKEFRNALFERIKSEQPELFELLKKKYQEEMKNMQQQQQPLKNLTESQKKAACHKDGPLLVIAGPGSGKTRVITYRIAALIQSGVRPYNICAITFTNKAANEMRQRASLFAGTHGVHISTFHSLCVRIIRQYGQHIKVKPNFSVYDDSDQLSCVKQAIKICGLDTTNFSPSRMLNAISALKNNLKTPQDYIAEADGYFEKSLAAIYLNYQQILDHKNALDFDDLLMKAALLLEQSEETRTQLSEKFKFLLIDEYQDTNLAQYKLAMHLVCTHNNICVTGDPDQSIYRWRGADIRNIMAFEKDWPNAQVVKLEENFRSTPNILKLADKLIANNRHRKEKQLIAARKPGKDVEISVFEDQNLEASGIAQKVRMLLKDGVKANDIAVFYRVNSMSRVIEESFIREKIPYQMVRGIEFYGRKEIKDVIAYLKLLANDSDDQAFMRIINTPVRGIGQTTVEKIGAYARSHGMSLYNAIKNIHNIEPLSSGTKGKIAAFSGMMEQFKPDISGPVASLMENVFTRTGLKDSLKNSIGPDDYAVDNVNELIASAERYDKETESPNLVDYLQMISLFSDADTLDQTNERVALMTLHAAKGLEFGNVFIAGLEEGLLPHDRSKDDECQLEEERRLFFVGITRAKDNLSISYARYRTIQGQFSRTVPSPFLYELGISLPDNNISLQKSFESDYEDTPDDDIYDDAYQVSPIYKKGQLVSHQKFGMGKIEQFVNVGENSTITVKFNSGQTKTLMIKYANLTIL